MISPSDLKVGSLYKTAAMTISFTKEIDEWFIWVLRTTVGTHFFTLNQRRKSTTGERFMFSLLS